jgi:hypothetical protein
MRGLVLFALGLRSVAAAAELFLGSYERVFFDASHRALFKMALLDRRDDITTVVLGSSRHADGFIPKLFDARTGEKSFNLAVSGLSFELEGYMIDRLLQKPPKVVVFELGDPISFHDDFRTVRAGPALWRLRASLRHDSIARLLAIAVAGDRFDGGETRGNEYA